jgi:hypothetical protein
VKRRLLNLLAALSLLLCAASISAWVLVANRTKAYVERGEATADVCRTDWVGVDSGAVVWSTCTLHNVRHAPASRRDVSWSAFVKHAEPLDIWALRIGSKGVRGLGFRFESDLRTNPQNTWVIICVPLWFLALVFASTPAMYLSRSLRRNREAGRECCRVCGYDLRATPERCPECGTPVQPASAQPAEAKAEVRMKCET